ncbi:LOW QUALITY PROTEIN: succinate receptor 1-like [Alosa alosa]|uniref:LOW QUALITY PROTEIN: succinate receptor 1-like n=1 Tax=Alosa alosa TaxID=278164 RepID=UPI00201537B3|nr:LOW QUALITY PROTEIN: succinate receptor 1-like [Alosa alosa]
MIGYEKELPRKAESLRAWVPKVGVRRWGSWDAEADSCTELTVILKKYYLCPMYALEFTLGFLGNLVVVLGYPLCLQEWRSTNVYLYNLAVSDIICVCALPRLSYLYANDMTETSSVSCVLNRYILFVNMYASILFMALVSLDRYLLLLHPQRTNTLLSLRGAVSACLVTWVAVHLMISPLLHYTVRSLADNNYTVCMDFASMSKTWGFLGYSLSLTCCGYVLPLVSLFVSTHKIASLLRVFVQRVKSFRRPLRIVQVAAYMFLLLNLPYYVMKNVRILSRLVAGLSDCAIVRIEALYIVTRPMAYMHTVIDPVFYFLMTERFRELLLARFHLLRRIIRSSIQTTEQ